MAYNNKKFVLDVNKFISDTITAINNVRKKVALDVFTRVIMLTPVDEGYARGNWQVTLGVPATRILVTPDPTGAGRIAHVQSKVEKLSWKYSSIFMTNNIHYIEKLEDGGYRGPTDKVTSSGYSKQAPSGMVKITLQEFPYIFEYRVREESTK